MIVVDASAMVELLLVTPRVAGRVTGWTLSTAIGDGLTDSDEVWGRVAEQRCVLADGLADLGDDEWVAASACEGWTNHNVLAHLVWLAELSIPRMLLDVSAASIRHRCGPITAIAPIAVDVARGTPPDGLRDRLRAASDGRFVPPSAPPEVALAEVVVHGMDITRPLGRPDLGSAEVIDRVTGSIRRFHKVYGTSREVRDATFVSTDTGWTSAGPGDRRIEAPSADLLLWAAGRAPG